MHARPRMAASKGMGGVYSRARAQTLRRRARSATGAGPESAAAERSRNGRRGALAGGWCRTMSDLDSAIARARSSSSSFFITRERARPCAESGQSAAVPSETRPEERPKQGF